MQLVSNQMQGLRTVYTRGCNEAGLRGGMIGSFSCAVSAMVVPVFLPLFLFVFLFDGLSFPFPHFLRDQNQKPQISDDDSQG